jgi:WD40 repeat protein
VYVGDLQFVTLNTLGAATVCVNCIGGSATAIENGGGTVVSRQWGYRTISGSGAITAMAGETGEVYVLKGASFAGPGTYYVVVTSTSACGPTQQVSNEWTVTVVDSVPSGEVQHLAASSRGTSASGQNRLLWVNTTGTIEEVRIRWDQAPVGTTDCLPPVNLAAPFDGEATITAPAGDVIDDFLHTGLLLDTAYCYSVFVKVSGVYSPGRTVKARPFDSTAGPVKWAYATGGTAVAAPTVSGVGILAMSNDRTVHALTRGSGGGEWPASWVPTELNGVAHSRSPVVPLLVPLGSASTVLFAADDAGFVHAVDAATGQRPWPARGPHLRMTGAPGGMFIQFNGNRDLLFVGTRDIGGDNSLLALNLADGMPADAYSGAGSPGPIGPINGTPAIDNAARRIYFASHARLTGDTLFCLEVSDPPTPGIFTRKWSRNLGNITGSPVLRGGRVYVGTDDAAGTIYSLDAESGLDDHTFTPSNGPVKGFLFPDRRNDDLIFATNTKVWSISDDGVSMTKNWEWTVGGPGDELNPSIVLLSPQTNFVYVGSKDGELYELDFSSATSTTPPTSKLVTLGGGVGQIGAPSLDIGATPKKLLLVGSEPGVIYAVEVPFP